MDDERTTRPDPPTALADGALAATLLVLAVAVIRLAGIDVSPSAIAVGAVSTLAFEMLAGRNADRVREAWARPAIRTVAVAGSLSAGALALFLRAGWLVVAGAAALGCYLLVLALVASRVIPPPGSWID